MDSNEFIKSSHRKAASIKRYIDLEAPIMVVRKTLRFIDGNFRAQGWQGATFQPWQKQKVRKGRILIMTGRLRRGTNYTSTGNGTVRFYNDVPYAKIHNEGGIINAVQQVKGFTRRRFYVDEVSAPGARKPKFSKTEVGKSEVKGFTRTMKTEMPQRQFMPYEGHESPVLNASIQRELKRDMTKILIM